MKREDSFWSTSPPIYFKSVLFAGIGDQSEDLKTSGKCFSWDVRKFSIDSVLQDRLEENEIVDGDLDGFCSLGWKINSGSASKFSMPQQHHKCRQRKECIKYASIKMVLSSVSSHRNSTL